MSGPEVVVLARDTETARECRRQLAGAGCDVRPAATLEQALDALGEGNARVLVVVQPLDDVDWRSLAQRAGGPRVILHAAGGSVRDAVRAIRDGAVDFLTDRDEKQALAASVLRHSQTGEPAGLISEDPRTRELTELALRVAERPVTVFLAGESGTGKEVFARFIHQHSPRAQRPFVAVNCAAIPEQMLEAVLFGFEKGAFTGASRSHAGKFEQAEGGTLLLDEVSEIAPALQAKLLRVLQEREVERLCGSGPRPVDVRVIATSNRDLRAEVQAGRFREDLYYRLHVFPLRLPALRQRPGDVVPMARAFIRRHCPDPTAPPVLEPEAAERLMAHAWPGNVRELENVIQRALVLADGGRLRAADLQFDPVPASAAIDDEADGAGAPLDARLRDREQRLIIDTLREMQGSRSATAERLGISVRTLRHKLQRMREQGLEVPGTARAQFA